MSNVLHRMRLIHALDPSAHICLSLNDTWYVSARIEISDGHLLTGATCHRDTIEEAVLAYAHRLCQVKLGGDEYIVSRGSGERIAYQWNGAAFTVVEQKAPTR